MIGSIVNRLQENAIVGAPEPAVGEGCTSYWYSDRTAHTVIRIVEVGKTGKRAGLPKVVEIQDDEAIRTDGLGMTDSGQTYEFKRNPNGRVRLVKIGRDGVWRVAHEDGKADPRGTRVVFGKRDAYTDPSF